jgi:hypothetical protein
MFSAGHSSGEGATGLAWHGVVDVEYTWAVQFFFKFKKA